MIINNHDILLKVNIGDSCVVCFDISSWYRENMAYFKCLKKVLDHLNMPEIIMRYLLNHDFLDFESQEIPATKMKVDIMWDQLPSPVQFIIDYIASWSKNCVRRFSCEKIYQDYLEWYGYNREKPLTSKVARKKFSLISIDQAYLWDNEVKVYQYIFDYSKIIAKLREFGLGDIEEFSDTSQADLPANETIDIPIFNVPETILPKIILTLSEKNTPLPNINKDKKVDKQGNLTQDLFDYISE